MPSNLISGQMSPDREYVWNGEAWIPAVSPDGNYRWDGSRWIPSPALARRPRSSGAVLWLLLSATGLFVLDGAYTAYIFHYAATCTAGGCQDIVLGWIFTAPPIALVGVVVAVIGLVFWRIERRLAKPRV